MNFSTKDEKMDASFYYRDDGLAEFFAGLGLIVVAMSLWADMIWMVAIYPVLFITAMRSAKEHYTLPRLSQVDWRPEKSGGRTLLLLLLAGLMAFVLVVLAFLVLRGEPPAWLVVALRQYALPTLGVLCASIWLLKAWFSQVARFYLYAALTLVLFLLAPYLGAGLLLPLGLLGVVLVAGGLLTLRRFVRRYPIS
jgi:hypothetical protein